MATHIDDLIKKLKIIMIQAKLDCALVGGQIFKISIHQFPNCTQFIKNIKPIPLQ